MMDRRPRARVLCVDDEPAVLEGLELHLRRRYELLTATCGPAALERLAAAADVAVVVSDMKMPAMDGATFLSRAKGIAPNAARILLTGRSDIEAAAAAVDDGRIFRFLMKPCPPFALLAAIEAGVEHHRLVTAERVLLEQTLHGSIKLLTDLLALTAPAAFGKATRIKRLVTELSESLEMPERWQVELAAMFSQLGFIILPPDVVDKVYYAHPISDAERQLVDKVPAAAEQLLENIPRLETVREILAGAAGSARPRHDARRADVAQATEVLRVAIDFDSLEAQGNSPPLAVNVMLSRGNRYDGDVLRALETVRGEGGDRNDVREVPLSALRVGMTFADDVKMTSGTLLVARGYEVTPGFLRRLRNFRPGIVKEPLRVLLRTAERPGAAEWDTSPLRKSSNQPAR